MLIIHFLMFIDLLPAAVAVCWFAHTHISFMNQFKSTGGHVGLTVQSSPYSQTIAENYPNTLTPRYSYG